MSLLQFVRVSHQCDNTKLTLHLSIEEHEHTIISCFSETAVSLICSFLEGTIFPQNGQILIDDNNFFSISHTFRQKVRQKTLIVTPKSALLPFHTVYENLVFSEKLKGKSSLNGFEKAISLLDKTDLLQKKDMAVHQLSLKEQQILLLLQGILFDPKLLCIDYRVLEQTEEAQWKALLLEQCNRGTTVVIISFCEKDIHLPDFRVYKENMLHL